MAAAEPVASAACARFALEPRITFGGIRGASGLNRPVIRLG